MPIITITANVSIQLRTTVLLVCFQSLSVFCCFCVLCCVLFFVLLATSRRRREDLYSMSTTCIQIPTRDLFMKQHFLFFVC